MIDVILQANVNGISNRFDASAGVLAHLTIDDEIIKHWNMALAHSLYQAQRGTMCLPSVPRKARMAFGM